MKKNTLEIAYIEITKDNKDIENAVYCIYRNTV